MITASKQVFIYMTMLLLLLVLPVVTLHTQTLAKNDALKFDADYYLMEKEFGKAQNNYISILRSEPDNADVKYRLGICYLNSENEKARAIPYLEEAIQKISEKYSPNSFKETNAPIDALFLLASAYRVNNELDKAINTYNRYKEYLDPKDNYNLEVVNQYISNCNLAREFQQHPVKLSAINLGKPVNTETPNYNAVLSGDGKTMIYTAPGRQGYEIFSSTYADTAWTTPKNITSVLGTGKYMKTSDLSNDGLTLLLMLDDPMNADIYSSHFSKGRWSKAEPLGKEINSKSNESHASLSADGQVLYFTSNRKGGEGDMDIYKSELDQKGEWGKAVNMGTIINTPFNEETPFITDDGQRLYFSSEGHEGIGGYDIFYYAFNNPTAGVINMGYPLNTTDNDLFYVPWGDGTMAYFSYKGSDSYGGRDIYRVRVEEAAEEVAMVVVPEEITAPAHVEEVIAPVETAMVEVVVEETAVEAVAVEAAAVEEIIIEEPVMEETAQEVAVAGANSESEGTNSYKVQLMALRKPVDLIRFSDLPGIRIVYGPDQWYRYTIGNYGKEGAENLRSELIEKGYRDAFIRGNKQLPRFTIQVMAVPGPVVDLKRFNNLAEISVTKGADHFCRYTTGEFETKADALADLKLIRELGYKKAFVTAIRIAE